MNDRMPAADSRLPRAGWRVPLFTTIALVLAAPLVAQDSAPSEEEDDYESSIVVTATRVTQGGAQDIEHFRSLALNGQGLPLASSLTAEGLLSEHDLLLPSTRRCEQLFCVTAQAMRADLPARPGDTVFLGLGFESGIDAELYRSRPISIIATVDRSGSMSGEPIERVKEGLRAVLDQLGEKDRFGIVIYGSDTRVHLPVMDVAGNKDAILAAVDAIAIDGSTYMEAGLRLGFETARQELEQSNGATRVMLFTDENPNVGNTSAEGFMGQARDAAASGIGLTTIGVGQIFRGALATKVSSVEGGNLFFLPHGDSAEELMTREFRNMVSPVATDIAIALAPAEGYRVGEVYGVPLDIMERAADGSVTVRIATAFLSSNGGGIFATLEPHGRASEAGLGRVSVSYVDALDGKRGEDGFRLAGLTPEPAANLRKAQLLVDQYTSMNAALARYHNGGNAIEAQRELRDLSERMTASGFDGLEKQIAMVDRLASKAVLIAQEDSQPGIRRVREVFGRWKVMRHRGVSDLARGDVLEFTNAGELITEHNSGPKYEDETYQDFAINEHRILIESDGKGASLKLRYRRSGDWLHLFATDGTSISMRRDGP